uniref:Cytochrome c oxidase subunit 2 n=1 Tax=Neelus murinus TaxID=1348065 RepID=A0A6B9IQI1_9HEXA|nr:cytochrome c oxidase subunit II [Neelus murinus]
MPFLSELNLQNSFSPLMEELTQFHDFSLTIILVIMTLVGLNMISSMKNHMINRNMLESHSMETFWTISPSLILIMIGLPSIRLLYLLDETFNPSITIKTMGHQWYWSYEFADFKSIEFDSYMNKDLNLNSFRLLDVDNRLILPIKSQIRNLVSAADVIHSWTIPSLGVKTDAIPGRLNQINFNSQYPKILFGQCSEICGANHSFMPICVETTKPINFIKWIKSL